jgi:group I intron endonuclease
MKTREVFGVIYKITNVINNKIYIGLTRQTINKRWSCHKCNAKTKRKRTHLALAMTKYGVENFKIEHLKDCYTPSELYNTEIYFIKIFDSGNRTIGYNNSTGGEVSTMGFRHSDSTKIKLSIASKGISKTNSGSFKKGHRRSVYTDEWRDKISKRLKGRKVSEAAKIKIRIARAKQVMPKRTDESKMLMSKIMSGRTKSKEHCENIRKSKMGNKNRLGTGKN